MSIPRLYRYKLVDVFAERAFEGNPLAVFPDAAGMNPGIMQAIAKELNLSETVFLLPSTRNDCLALAKIFTPKKEMEFAGHPTIGASFVLLAGGTASRSEEHFYLEEKIGPVRIFAEGGDHPVIWLTTPPIRADKTYSRSTCATALGLSTGDLLECTPQLLSAGNPTIFVAVANKEAVDKAWLDLAGLNTVEPSGEPVCVFVFCPTQDGAYARMFAPAYGIPEDPATGSSAGPLSVYMTRHGLNLHQNDKRFVIEQGTKLGRRSILYVQADVAAEGTRIQVGGRVVQIGEGALLV